MPVICKLTNPEPDLLHLAPNPGGNSPPIAGQVPGILELLLQPKDPEIIQTS